MKKQMDLLGVFLAACTGIACFATIFLRAFFPRHFMPNFDSTAIVALTLAALLFDHYLCKGSHRKYWQIPLYGALIFGLFPFAASIFAPLGALKTALLGAVLLTVITYLFDMMVERLSTSPATKIAPIASAFVLFLATQCLMGIV